MDIETSPPAALPRDLPVLAVLGLAAPGDADWPRLRAMQYASLSRVTVLRSATHVVAALAVALMFLNTINSFAIAVWFAALLCALWYSARVDASLDDADRRGLRPFEVARQTLVSIAIALVWVVPVAAFCPFADSLVRLKLWTVLAMLMTASAIALPAVPMGTLLFASVAGGASIAAFVLAGTFDIALIALGFVGVVCAGAVKGARRYLIARIAETVMVEKNAVVSLLLREFQEGEADWLWETDPARRVRAVSPRFAFALGRDPREIEGKAFLMLIAGPAWETGQFPPSMHELAERLKRRESFSNLLVRVSIDGQQRWWELSGTPRTDENGNFEGFRGVGSDVTAQRESSDKIAYMARYDTLTSLPNRMMLTETLADALDYAEKWRTRCAFLMIDLDRFKAVNDSLGHLVGDQMLAKVSARLRELMTDNEICGRLGGDEFAIVIRDASNSGHVNRIAQAVIERLSQPYEVDHHTLYVGASVGSAIGPRDGNSVETLMRNADLALYRAKDEGGGAHFCYEPALHAHAEERRKLEFSLRRALDRGEFALHYQPVVDARTSEILSFEALLRWHSADHGTVSPAKFIPLAEDTRLIVPIGEWVLREACHEAMNWPSPTRVAVNVSGEQLLDPNFAASVVGALASSGLCAQRLEIEVTESIFVRDASHTRTALEHVMALGCGVALDDFGTGYSSLGYLRRLRFSTIKVDRSFVQGAATGNPESLAIIRAVVAMADSLEMSTTAEGVETERELDVVRALGCGKVQGYYFGRPMPAEDALALFRHPQHLSRGGSAA